MKCPLSSSFLVVSAVSGALASVLGGCSGDDSPEVVVYTSVDQPFAAALLAHLEKQAGLRVRAQYDTEAGKTTGLVRRILRERDRPKCDVWWSSEVFGTLELGREGLLEPYISPAAADIPAEWKDASGMWTGMAARARVLAFDPRRVSRDQLPRTWRDVGRPEWAGRLAIANPLFGTTRGHLAAMFAVWGDADGRAFLGSLRSARARVTDGNSMAVQALSRGEADICATDTDDVWAGQRRGQPIDLVYPTLEPGGSPLWIPCTVALVRGAPHPEAARRLVDLLLSVDAEQRLADSDSRNVPVRPRLRDASTPAPVAIDYARAAQSLGAAESAAKEILLK